MAHFASFWRRFSLLAGRSELEAANKKLQEAGATQAAAALFAPSDNAEEAKLQLKIGKLEAELQKMAEKAQQAAAAKDETSSTGTLTYVLLALVILMLGGKRVVPRLSTRDHACSVHCQLLLTILARALDICAFLVSRSHNQVVDGAVVSSTQAKMCLAYC